MIIYLNNYRGFSNTFIPINDVTFLVGENSTGKSSLLSIISLLSDPNFLTTGEFKNQFLDLGPFAEVVSQGYENIFIGIIKEEGNSKFDDTLTYDGVLLKLEQKKGFANLTNALLFKNKSILFTTYKSKSIDFKLKKIKQSKDFIKNYFTQWSNNQKYTDNLKDIDSGHIDSTDVKDGFFGLLENNINAVPLLISFFIRGKEKEDDARKKLYNDFIGNNFRFGHKSILQESIWVDPIRTKPKRFYEPEKGKYSAEGEHTPSTLREIYANKIKNKKIIKSLEDYGKFSGLFEKIIIKDFQKDIELSPFELKIDLNGKELKISNVGYGVSQILPILTEILWNSKNHSYLIQQPEVHLHPKSQAFFGEFIFNQFSKDKKAFIVETHSDFIINRFRINIRLSRIKNIEKKINILFFTRKEQGNCVTPISIDKNGDYINLPDSFREFFLQEELAFLGF